MVELNGPLSEATLFTLLLHGTKEYIARVRVNLRQLK